MAHRLLIQVCNVSAHVSKVNWIHVYSICIILYTYDNILIYIYTVYILLYIYIRYVYMYICIYRLNVFQAENSTCRRSSVLGLKELFHPEFWIHMNSKRPRIRIFRSQLPLPTLFSRSFFHWFLLHPKKHIDLLGKGTECNQQMMKTHNDLVFVSGNIYVCMYLQTIQIYIYT